MLVLLWAGVMMADCLEALWALDCVTGKRVKHEKKKKKRNHLKEWIIVRNINVAMKSPITTAKSKVSLF
jgi:hypothetical protein